MYILVLTVIASLLVAFVKGQIWEDSLLSDMGIITVIFILRDCPLKRIIHLIVLTAMHVNI